MLRSLWRTPGFTAVVVLTLGLGLAARTALFGVTPHTPLTFLLAALIPALRINPAIALRGD